MFTNIFSKRHYQTGDGENRVPFSAGGRPAQLAAKIDEGAKLFNVFLGKLDSVQKANTLRFTTYVNLNSVHKVS